MKYKQCPKCYSLIPSTKSVCKCGHEIEGKRLELFPEIKIFPSGYFRDIDDNPVYIKGRKQLLSETRRRGQVSLYAED